MPLSRRPEDTDCLPIAIFKASNAVKALLLLLGTSLEEFSSKAGKRLGRSPSAGGTSVTMSGNLNDGNQLKDEEEYCFLCDFLGLVETTPCNVFVIPALKCSSVCCGMAEVFGVPTSLDTVRDDKKLILGTIQERQDSEAYEVTSEGSFLEVVSSDRGGPVDKILGPDAG